MELINLQNKQVVITNTHTERKLTHERTSSQIHQQSQIYIWFWGAECGHSTDIVCQRHLVVEEKPNACLQKSWSGSSGWSSELLRAVSCRNYVIYLRKRASSHQDTKERLSSGESEITKSWFQGLFQGQQKQSNEHVKMNMWKMQMTFCTTKWDKETSSIQRSIQSKVYCRYRIKTLYFQFGGVSLQKEKEKWWL